MRTTTPGLVFAKSSCAGKGQIPANPDDARDISECG